METFLKFGGSLFQATKFSSKLGDDILTYKVALRSRLNFTTENISRHSKPGNKFHYFTVNILTNYSPGSEPGRAASDTGHTLSPAPSAVDPRLAAPGPRPLPRPYVELNCRVIGVRCNRIVHTQINANTAQNQDLDFTVFLKAHYLIITPYLSREIVAATVGFIKLRHQDSHLRSDQKLNLAHATKSRSKPNTVIITQHIHISVKPTGVKHLLCDHIAWGRRTTTGIVV